MPNCSNSAVALALLSAMLVAGCSSSDTAETLVPVTQAPPVAVELAAPSPTSAGAVQAVAPGGLAPAAAPPVANALVSPVAPSVPAPLIDAALASTTLRIAPVTGAPRAAVSPLSRAMAARGQEIGLGFSRGGGASHTLRGFFSINDDGADTRVVYIWDVLSADGRRVHRIRGQERLPAGAGGDPWRSVPVATMERIGATTIDRFASWRKG